VAAVVVATAPLEALGTSDADFVCDDASGASLTFGLVVPPARRIPAHPVTISACEKGAAAGAAGSGATAAGCGLGIAACGPPAGTGDPLPVPLARGSACCAASNTSPKPDGAWDAGPDED
jgi:hypothetical protein